MSDREIIKEYFVKNYDWYKDECLKRKTLYSIYIDIYDMRTTIDYQRILGEFEEMRKLISSQGKCEGFYKNYENSVKMSKIC